MLTVGTRRGHPRQLHPLPVVPSWFRLRQLGLREGNPHNAPRGRFCLTKVAVDFFPPDAGFPRSFFPPDAARLSCRIFTRSTTSPELRRGDSLAFKGRFATFAS